MKNPEKYALPIQQKPLIPLAFCGKKPWRSKSILLAGDVGGTKTNLALFKIEENEIFLLSEKSCKTKDYTSLLEVMHNFLGKNSLKIDIISLGIAGPIHQGKVRGTNFSWEIDSDELIREFNTTYVFLINDMEANAYGLAALQKKDLYQLKPGAKIHGNAAIISPGTGLGEAGLYWDGKEYHPFATEGGHSYFSPKTDLDLEIWQYFYQKYEHVSWERLLSGQGIHDLYKLLRNVSREKESDGLKLKMAKGNPPAVITETAMEGTDLVCIETLDLFVRFLAIECSQVALKLKATGGIYIGGGILPKIIKGINKNVFRDNFVSSDRMNSLLQMVPVHLVLNERTALLGAAFYGAMSCEKI